MSAQSRDLLLSLASSPSMRGVYNDQNLVLQMLRFELALAEAEAECGVIPSNTALALQQLQSTDWLDFEALAASAPLAGNVAIPFIKQLTTAVTRHDAEAASFLHWGATSQDVIDSASMLQARAALKLLDQEMLAMCAALAEFSGQYAATAIPGRTWLQHATPVSVGLKTAGWLDALLDLRERLQSHEQQLPLQFGGASGTLAALGPHGDRIGQALGKRLGLRLPSLPWHAARIPVVELGSALGMLLGSLGKIARDVALLMQTEVGEMSEPKAAGKGGSSTMAHKRNPVGCAIALAAAQRAPGLVATLMAAMVQEHERGLGGWQAEWAVLPELFLLAGGSSSAMLTVLEGLEIDQARIAHNLGLEAGLSMAEAASFALAEKYGRSHAKELVDVAIARVRDNPGTSLKQALMSIEQVARDVPQSALDAMLDPAGYLGSARVMIDRVLKRYQASVA
jgi:3-carboxy-cis,cis-muconate cycloisomerase